MIRLPLKILLGVAVWLIWASADAIVAQSDNDVPQAGRSVLVWNNGDQLPGRPLSISGGIVTWQSSVFRDPLQVNVDSLRSLSTSVNRRESADAGAFEIRLQNGDVLSGDFVGATDELYLFRSRQHGEFAVRRPDIDRLLRLDSDQVVYRGPRGLRDWQSQNQQNPLSDWTSSTTGEITTGKRGAGLFLPVPLPSRCEIELWVRSTQRCSFALGLRNSNRGLRLETWDNTLVAARGLEFQEIRTLEPDETHLHLTVWVDLDAGALTAVSEAGVPLAEFRFQDEDGDNSGIFFGNRDGDITLEYLRISRWNGVLPLVAEAAAGRVELSDGTVRSGLPRPFSSAERSFRVGDESAVIPRNELRCLYQPSTDVGVTQPLVRVATASGELISGDAVEYDGQRLTVTAAAMDQPLSIPLDDVIVIQWPEQNAATAVAKDSLNLAGVRFSGELVIAEDSPDPLQWRPAGGQQSVVLSGSGNAAFRRRSPVTEPVDHLTYPHVLHLVDGTVLPCRILHASATDWQVESPFCGTVTVSDSDVHAAELTANGIRRQSQFDGGQWFNERARFEDDGQKIVLQPGGVIHNAELMAADLVQFRCDWQDNSLCVLGVYCTRPTWQGEQPDFYLAFRDNTVHVCPDLLSITTASAAHLHGASDDLVVLPDGMQSALIEARLTGDVLSVHINGQPAADVPTEFQRAAFPAISIRDLGIGVARTATSRNGTISPGGQAPIELSEFEISCSVLTAAHSALSSETRRLASLTPRFRRERPSSHILLAANGDLLRGRLKQLADDMIRFESRLEDILIPRERVVAVICLQSPDDRSRVSEREFPVTVRLANGFSVAMQPLSAAAGELNGNSEVLGACRVPIDQIAELLVGEPVAAISTRSSERWVLTPAPEPSWGRLVFSASQADPAELIGERTPDAAVTTLAGEEFRFADQSDRVLVIDFWTTWCAPCRESLPQLSRLVSEFPPGTVRLVAVNLQEDAVTVRRFLKDAEVTAVAVQDADGDLAGKFRVTGIPFTVVVRDGVIADIHAGHDDSTLDSIRSSIREALRQSEP